MSPDAPWTIGRLLKWTTEFLQSHGSESARLDAEVLLAHACECKRIELYTKFEEVPTDETRNKFKALVKRRADGEPVAYLVGVKEFYSLEFEVTPAVLIPRPDTEQMLVTLTDRVKENPVTDRPLKICDVGTGSGVLAVCAAKYHKQANVLATDTSAEALAVAKRNAERHGVADRVFCVEADLFPANKPAMGLDYILSNPPYVTTNELMNLDPTVKDFEPHSALDGGPDGMDAIERLVPAAAAQLRPGGVLLMEISPMIAQRVESLVDRTDGLERRETIGDLENRPRIIESLRK